MVMDVLLLGHVVMDVCYYKVMWLWMYVIIRSWWLWVMLLLGHCGYGCVLL